MKIKGIANFLATLKIEALIARIQPGTLVHIDLSEAKLVDHSILENLYEFQRKHADSDGKVIINGLDKHVSSCHHKLSLKLLPQTPHTRKTQRQIRLAEMTEGHDWNIKMEASNNLKYFESFYFFKTRPIEQRVNTITPQDARNKWEICDITFEEGAYSATAEYNTTVCLVKATKLIPKFVIEKKSFTDRYLSTSWHKDIDYLMYHEFSDDFIVKVKTRETMAAFLTPEVKNFIENSDIHHLESNGEEIMVFNDSLRLAQISDYSEMVRFSEELQGLI